MPLWPLLVFELVGNATAIDDSVDIGQGPVNPVALGADQLGGAQADAGHTQGRFQFVCEHGEKTFLLLPAAPLVMDFTFGETQVKERSLALLFQVARTHAQQNGHQQAAEKAGKYRRIQVPFVATHTEQKMIVLPKSGCFISRTAIAPTSTAEIG